LRVWTELILEVAVVVAGIIAVAAAHSRNALLCLLLVLIWAAAATFWHTRQDLIFFVTGAVVGPVASARRSTPTPLLLQTCYRPHRLHVVA